MLLKSWVPPPILGETFGLEKMKNSVKCRQLFFQALKYCLKLADTDKNGTLDFQAIGFGWRGWL